MFQLTWWIIWSPIFLEYTTRKSSANAPLIFPELPLKNSKLKKKLNKFLKKVLLIILILTMKILKITMKKVTKNAWGAKNWKKLFQWKKVKLKILSPFRFYGKIKGFELCLKIIFCIVALNKFCIKITGVKIIDRLCSNVYLRF